MRGKMKNFVAVICIALISVIVYSVIVPVFGMEVTSTLEAEMTTSLPNKSMEVKVKAKGASGKVETIFLLYMKCENAGLSDGYRFTDEIAKIIALDSEIALNRIYREEHRECYWFSLEEGKKAEFNLVCEMKENESNLGTCSLYICNGGTLEEAQENMKRIRADESYEPVVLTWEEEKVEEITEETQEVERTEEETVQAEETVEIEETAQTEEQTQEETTEEVEKSIEKTTEETTKKVEENIEETTEETIGEVEKSIEETIEEDNKVIGEEEKKSLEYKDDSVEVNVTAKAGLIPENTVLQVLSIEKEHEAYSEIEKKLQEKASGEDYEIAGFLAYDISFIDKDGNKIEPSGEVTVTIDYKKAAVPKDVSTNENTNITVMHLEEDSRGEVAQVVDMEQSEQLVNLEVNKEQAVEKVEFKTESFSTFTIAWIRTTTDTPINAHYGYLADGKWVEFDTKIVMTSKEMKDGEEEDFYNYKLGNSDRFTENGKKYKFNSLRLYNSRAAEFRYLKISVLNQGWGTQCKFSYSMNGTTYNSTDVQSELEIYYVYEEIETDSEIPKETESETQVETETKSPVSGGSNQSAESKELTEVTTVDSKSLGITMRMINYDNKLIKDDRSWFLRSEVQSKYGLYNEFDAKTFNGAYDGKVQQGLVEKVLKDGYPAVVKNNTNNSWNSQYPTLKGLFAENTTDGDVKDVNHLFIQSTYDNTGYLEYSSFENYAYLEESGDFTVYNQIGTQSDGTGYDSNRGNFMPYNKIEAGKIAKTSKNLYDEHGNSLKSTANQEGSRYNEDLYLTQGENDYFFGLYMEANFMQPENGRVTHKGTTQNMIYEFNGDDDLWVYIDNVLVLDIGGVHSAHSGKIDFATGEVEVEIYYPTTSGVTEARKQQTNIRQLFKAAGILPNGDAWNEKEANQYFIGNTFKDYTNHTFKMFYMERGAGASNLHMSFNLQVLPDVEITKEFVDENGNKVEASDSNEEFSFLVELKRGTNSTIGNYEGNYYLKNSEGKYCYYDTNGELQTSFEKKYYGTTTNGMIKLKVGYTIVIENVPAGTEFRVSEKELNKNIYDTPNTSGEHCIVTSNENGVIAGRTLKNETAKVVITNRLRKIEIYQLPSSGGPGTYLFTISGVAILMTAILMAIQSRKRTVK